jgi:hypothetical protein
MAIAVSVTNGGVNAIVGSAISAALLAPIVNAGICFSFAFKYHVFDNQYNDANFYAQIGGVSNYHLASSCDSHFFLSFFAWLFPFVFFFHFTLFPLSLQVSFALFMVDFSCISIMGFLTFRYVKDVKPENKQVFSFDSAYSPSFVNQLNTLHEPKPTVADTRLSEVQLSGRVSEMKNKVINNPEEELEEGKYHHSHSHSHSLSHATRHDSNSVL